MGVILTTYKSWDDPPSTFSKKQDRQVRWSFCSGFFLILTKSDVERVEKISDAKTGVEGGPRKTILLMG